MGPRQRLAVADLSQTLYPRSFEFLAEVAPGLDAVHWTAPVMGTRSYHVRTLMPLGVGLPFQDLLQSRNSSFGKSTGALNYMSYVLLKIANCCNGTMTKAEQSTHQTFLWQFTGKGKEFDAVKIFVG